MARPAGPWDDGDRAWARLAAWLTRPPDGTAAGDAALDAMADIGTLRRLLDRAELAAVRTARRNRKSWAEIATQLGITRQSAWERWRELDDEPDAEPWTVVARPQRGRGKVVVPDVVGLTWDDARHALASTGLLATGSDPDAPPLAALGWPNVVVVDQIPEAGAKVPVGTRVRLWLERGGGSAGVREPRRPAPAPKSGTE